MTTTSEPAKEPARSASTSERAMKRALLWPTALFVILATILMFFVGDLRFDLARGVPAAHVEVELVALAFAFVGVVGTTVNLVSLLRRARELQRALLDTREDAERWRAEKEALLRRFGMAVEHHFQQWGLTSAEKEIAVLVLRGLSYKEVASARGTAERTVRHQALGIYRKAGVTGRAEMAAVFLRDVVSAAGPDPEAQPAPPPGPALVV